MSSGPTIDEALAAVTGTVPFSARDTTVGVPTTVDTIPVLHLINAEHFAGAERVQDLLAARLPKEGFAIGFGCLKPDQFPRRRKDHTAPLFDLRMSARFDVRPGWRAAEIIRREGYRLIHSHTPRSALIGRIASRLTGVPLIHHVHSPTSRDSTNRLRNMQNMVIERFSLKQAARLIAVSTSLGRHLQQSGYPAERIAVVPNGVPRLSEVLPRETPTTPWTLGAVALFRPRKGLEVLLDAVAALKRQGVDVQLRAVGDFETPEYEAEIKTHMSRLQITGDVIWTGFTDDINAELQQIDLFVLPSLFGEGLPMVVLEAMAAGVPVVATRVEGVPEAIRDGIDGVLAEPGNAEDLARAISAVVLGQFDWAALRRSAVNRQADHFSDLSMASRVAQVYHEVLIEQG